MNLRQKLPTASEPLNSSIYERHPFVARIPVRDTLTNLRKIVDCKVLHFINNENQEALGYKTLRRKDAVTFFRENKASVTFCICSPLYFLV